MRVVVVVDVVVVVVVVVFVVSQDHLQIEMRSSLQSQSSLFSYLMASSPDKPRLLTNQQAIMVPVLPCPMVQ